MDTGIYIDRMSLNFFKIYSGQLRKVSIQILVSPWSQILFNFFFGELLPFMNWGSRDGYYLWNPVCETVIGHCAQMGNIGKRVDGAYDFFRNSLSFPDNIKDLVLSKILILL